MTGTGHSTSLIPSSGIQRIDGILGARKWADTTVTYSTPTNSAAYGAGYGSGEANGFFAASPAMRTASHFALNKQNGKSSDDGFSVEGFTNLNIVNTSAANAHLRIAQTTSGPYDTAWIYYPSTARTGGDGWFSNKSFNYATPKAGNYSHLTMLHELAHGLGLEHSHETGTLGKVPAAFDSMEYTVMSYRSFPGAPTSGGYMNENFGYAQTYMMLDIAALQHLYGADFSTNSGNTTYSWTPNNGITKVNGGHAIAPGANRIFATVWDGGGKDTYDLSAYSTAVKIDLAPGGFSIFSYGQRADLGGGHKAKGNIYNALQFKGDNRSLIEDAIGGQGNDILKGNQVSNKLTGNNGNDKISGLNGKDTLFGNKGNDSLFGGNQDDFVFGGPGNDILYGGNHNDILRGEDGKDKLYGGLGIDQLFGGTGEDLLEGGGGNDKLFGGLHKDVLRGHDGNDTINGDFGDDRAFGGNGNDTINGGAGKDTLEGGNGKDKLLGGDGNDLLRGKQGNDIVNGQNGNDNLIGDGGDDVLYGGASRDTLRGGTGKDKLIGNKGTDQLYGGAGADHFRFTTTADSVVGSGRDKIHDFERGLDKIDLSPLTGTPFKFAGNFTGNGPTVIIRAAGADRRVLVDADGDMVADMEILVANVHTLNGSDFIL